MKPTCPSCKKEIDVLDIESKRTDTGKMWVENGDTDTEWDDTMMEPFDSFKATCPECGHVVADDYYDAEAFLTGDGEE